MEEKLHFRSVSEIDGNSTYSRSCCTSLYNATSQLRVILDQMTTHISPAQLHKNWCLQLLSQSNVNAAAALFLGRIIQEGHLHCLIGIGSYWIYWMCLINLLAMLNIFILLKIYVVISLTRSEGHQEICCHTEASSTVQSPSGGR